MMRRKLQKKHDLDNVGGNSGEVKWTADAIRGINRNLVPSTKRRMVLAIVHKRRDDISFGTTSSLGFDTVLIDDDMDEACSTACAGA